MKDAPLGGVFAGVLVEGQLMAQKAVSCRRSLVNASAADRAAILKQLKSFSDEAAAIQKVLSSPMQMLDRVGLGDLRKTQLMLQLQGVGRYEVENAARCAVYASDLVLASAVLLIVGRQQRDERAFPLP